MKEKTSLAHKSIKNSIYNVMGFICPIGLSLVFTPYIVHNLGNDAYGILAIVSMVTGYFAFLNLGLGTAGLKYVSEYYAKKDYDTVNSIINILILIYGILGIIGLISILTLTNLLATKVFKIPMNMVNVTKFAFYISAFGFLITFIKSVFASIPKALHRFDIENIISIIFGSASSLLAVLLLFIGFGFKEIVILRFGIGLAMLFVLIIVVKRLLPFYKLRIKFDKKLIKKLFSFGIFEFFTQLTNITSYHAAKIIIAAMLGPFWLTYYVIPQTLTVRVNGFIYKISEIIFPLSSELSSTGQHKRLTNMYLKMSRITLVFKLAIYVPLIMFSYKILYFWMGEDFAKEGWIVMVFLCSGFFLNSIALIPAIINLGLAKPKINAFFSVIVMVVQLTLLFPLTKLMGIKGSALSVLIAMGIAPFFLFFVNWKVLKISNIVFFNRVFFRPLGIAIIQIIFIELLLLKFVNNIFTLIILLGISIMINLILSWIFHAFEKDEKKQIIEYFKKTFKF